MWGKGNQCAIILNNRFLGDFQVGSEFAKTSPKAKSWPSETTVNNCLLLMSPLWSIGLWPRTLRGLPPFLALSTALFYFVHDSWRKKLNNANSFEADFSCGIRTPYLQCLGQKHLEFEMWGFWNIWIFILRHLFRDPRRNKKFISVFIHTACVFFMAGMLAFWLEVIRYGIFHLWIKLAFKHFGS